MVLCPDLMQIYLSGEDPRFYKRGIGQYSARLSGGFQSPTEINASGGSQPRKEEGASHHARRGKNAEAFLKSEIPQNMANRIREGGRTVGSGRVATVID